MKTFREARHWHGCRLFVKNSKSADASDTRAFIPDARNTSGLQFNRFLSACEICTRSRTVILLHVIAEAASGVNQGASFFVATLFTEHHRLEKNRSRRAILVCEFLREI